MAELTPNEPQHARDYDDRSTEAVRSVLVEIGQILGSFQGKFAVVGGAVPWLLLDNVEMPHVGTIDIDLGLDAAALQNGEYVHLVEGLRTKGYDQSTLKKFQLVRTMKATDGNPIQINIDFLMPREVQIEKNKPPILDDFAVQRADGADLALRFNQLVAVRAAMPEGGMNTVEIAVCSIPALLAMKGFALQKRYKQKDAYDIYYCIRNYPGGIDELATDCRPILELPSGAEGYGYIAAKFDSPDGFGATCVKNFVAESDTLGGRTPDQWQQDAFGQVDAWLRALSLRV
jgi:hypothetical protein